MCHFWLSEKTFFKYLFFHLPNMLKDFVWLFTLSSVTHFGHMIYLKNIAQMLYFCRVLSFCNAVPYLAASVQASCKLLKSSRASKEAVIKKKNLFFDCLPSSERTHILLLTKSYLARFSCLHSVSLLVRL